MQNICTHCSAPFEITEDDLAFYEKVSPIFAGKKELIPPPTLCPDCRRQRRLAFRNERSLYHRKCDLTGKQIISIYAPEKPYRIYHQKEWWSDRWDPLSYGQGIDWKQPFFRQFQALLQQVPLPHISMESCENSEYANFCWQTNNSYLVFGTDRSEDCYYCNLLIDCKNCVDCSCSKQCSYCYQIVDCTQCYRCFYSKECMNCDQVDFSIDCRNCKDCFGCTGLRNKQYHLFNQPLSKNDYASKLSELVLHEDAIKKAKALAAEQWTLHPRIYAHLSQCEECTGDNLLECKRCLECFDGMQAVDCVRVQNIPGNASDCEDVYAAGYGSEHCYESYCVAAKNTLFSFLIYPSGNNVFYSAYCSSCQDIFGCIGLRHKQYCIFNKQYSKEQYETLVPNIVEHMRGTGEWGEFFPVELSPFDYNETIAHEYFPLTKEEVVSRGWSWHEELIAADSYLGPTTDIPAGISAVSDTICEKILRCETSGKTYKIIPQELKFYREMGIPIPKKCPDQRHLERMAMRNPRKLWDRQCAKCSKAIRTTYQPSPRGLRPAGAPERTEIVYCEECYFEAVY